MPEQSAITADEHGCLLWIYEHKAWWLKPETVARLYMDPRPRTVKVAELADHA